MAGFIFLAGFILSICSEYHLRAPGVRSLPVWAGPACWGVDPERSYGAAW